MTEENTTQNMPFDLYKSETLERFQDNLVECATYNMTQESHQMSLIIRGLLEQSPNLQTDQPELYQKYWELYWQFCWIALNYFSDERVIAMFQKHYLVSADIPFIDIWDKVKFISLNHILIEDRNRFKESIIKALRKNQEVLTKETVTKDGKENPGTVGHWIMDSTIELGLKSVEAVKLAEYLVNSTNTKSLSKESRDRIRKLIDLIEHLKIPSDTLEGYEPIIAIDDDRSVGAIRAGVWEQYDDSLKKIRQSIADTMDSLNLGPASGSVTPAKAKEPIQRRTATQTLKKEPAVLPDITLKEVKHLQTKDLINIYTQNKEEQTAIYEEEKKILALVGKDNIDVRKELAEAIKQNNRSRLIAFLIVLAKTKDLFSIIKADRGFRQHLNERHGIEAEQQFDKTPEDPVFYSLWLQYVLRMKAKMLESDSARVGTKLANLAGRKYLKTAYIDSNSGSFKWVPIKKEQGRLVLVS